MPPCELRLILGSQITQEDHAETIIEPEERSVDAKDPEFRRGLPRPGPNPRELSNEPFSTDELEHLMILPPTVRVRGRGGRETLIPNPDHATEWAIQSRARKRFGASQK